MKTNRTYSLKASTNGYIAKRDARFDGKTEITIESGLSLNDARKKLLALFNECFCDELPYVGNWGLAVMLTSGRAFGATKTFSDGTRSFDYDGRRFFIEVEE